MDLARYARAYRWMGEPMGRFRFQDEDEQDARADDFRCPDCEKPTGDGRLCAMCQADRTDGQ
jgi:hypothetical protein